MFLPSNSDRSRCEDSCSDGQGKDVAKMLMFAATLTFLHIATQVTRIGLVTGPTGVATCGLTSSMQKVWQGRGFSTLPMNQVDIPFNILLAYGETSEDVYIQDSEPELRLNLLCFCWSKHFFRAKTGSPGATRRNSYKKNPARRSAFESMRLGIGRAGGMHFETHNAEGFPVDARHMTHDSLADTNHVTCIRILGLYTNEKPLSELSLSLVN